LQEFIEAVEEAARDAEKLCELLERVAADPFLLEALTPRPERTRRPRSAIAEAQRR
jgi:hypothetical protein